jgi:aspartyl/glutamyl-tRNA(Asn/Gln) amidotransferase C subunit
LDEGTAPDASRIAHFSRIAIGSGAIAELQSRFDTLIHAFDVVRSVEVPPSKELLEPHQKDELRKDETRPSLGQAKSLSNAPSAHEGHFRVPPVLS